MPDDELACRPSCLAPGLLTGQVILVAGGGSGIGRATAWLAARLGARVLILGRKADKLERVAAALRTAGHACETAALDVRDRSAVDRMQDDVMARHGRIDLIVNSAGGQFPRDAIDISENGWRAVVETNLTGTFNLTQAAARRWRDAGAPGSIVTIVISPRGLHQVAHSCAARAGVVAWTEAVAVEWAPFGIRANCIAPGSIVSEGWAVYAEDVRSRYTATNPMRRAATPWDIAEASLFVGGPAGGFITGQTLHVNGGSHLWGETWTGGKPAYFKEATRVWQD